MITLKNCTPEVYYNQSRDFQFIGRLFDLVLNSIKTNADLMENIPLNDNTDERLIDLVAMSLGFKASHNYNIKQLRALCSAFHEILKEKGNIKSILLAGQTLFNAEGVEDKFNCYIKDNILYILIPQSITDINLFKDLLAYILPAGLSCKIIRTNVFKTTKASTILTSTDKVSYKTLSDNNIIKANEASTDFSANGNFINNTIIKANQATKEDK